MRNLRALCRRFPSLTNQPNYEKSSLFHIGLDGDDADCLHGNSYNCVKSSLIKPLGCNRGYRWNQNVPKLQNFRRGRFCLNLE